MRPINKFPRYLLQSLRLENSNQTPTDQEQAKLLEILFNSRQHLNMTAAMQYAESEFLNRDINTITAKALEIFIKKIHQFIANDLLLLNAKGRASGEYSTKRTMVAKLADQTRSYEPLGSESNIKLLKELHGANAPNEFQDFYHTLQIHRNALQEKYTKQPNPAERFKLAQVSVIELIEQNNLHKHPGYSHFERMMHWSPVTEQIPLKMRDFCEGMIKLIKQGKPEVTIAAHAILQLTQIHPFANGNGRTARLIANCLLMMLGHRPVNFDQEKDHFHAAIQSQQITRLEKLIRELANREIKPNEKLPLLDNPHRPQALGFPKHDLFSVSGPGYMDLVKLDKLQQYMAQIGDIIATKLASKEVLQKTAGNAAETANRQMKINRIITEMEKPLLTELVFTRIDADYCHRQAVNYFQQKNPLIAAYYYRLAADLAQQDGQKPLAVANHFMNAADAYYAAPSEEGAFNSAMLAHNLLSAHTDEALTHLKERCTSNLKSLAYVKEHRNQLFRRQITLLSQPSSKVASNTVAPDSATFTTPTNATREDEQSAVDSAASLQLNP